MEPTKSSAVRAARVNASELTVADHDRSAFTFTISHEAGSARAGVFTTPHGPVETPAFMPVATHGTIRGLSMHEIRAAGAQMVLANALHLYLRPGDEHVREAGGVQEFSRWRGPMLTDSGGFQVFSLARKRTVSEAGVEFRSPIEGSLHQYTPEKAMQVQRNLGADVVMQLDELVEGGAPLDVARAAMERSLRWLDRSRAEHQRLVREDPGPAQTLFPIVQGGTDVDLRRASVAGILGMGDWKGIAIGGVSVGEPKPELHRVLETCDPILPRALPRYLMGVGHPDDLIEGIRRGVDLFDCVAPTRMGRHGTAFTPDGTEQIRQSGFRSDRRALVEGCGCPCCTEYDRAYLRHLFVSEEMLGPRLLALHNVWFLTHLVMDARAAIRTGAFAGWSADRLQRLESAAGATRSG
ncbi:MAG: tRNA guanosine(34) transglycosylase Tgt [Gemmatimonadetes bacterium]|nr:tRNA guanosine(34) transglycosylase Tgt [Gemmatimonadota bacterium]